MNTIKEKEPTELIIKNNFLDWLKTIKKDDKKIEIDQNEIKSIFLTKIH